MSGRTTVFLCLVLVAAAGATFTLLLLRDDGKRGGLINEPNYGVDARGPTENDRRKAVAESLADKPAQLRIAEYERIGRAGPLSREDESILRKAFVTDPDSEARRAAFRELADGLHRRAPWECTALIEQTLDNGTTEARINALRAAARHPSPVLLEQLLGAADDPNVRSHAWKALAFVEHADAKAKVLEAASNDELSPEERVTAVALIGQTMDQSARPLLARLAGHESRELREVAQIVMEKLQK
ncbi:MAG: HEAT repeat domain-containing protein [Nitrospira sp.]|nr:HEAT repeat domain-containing protein [Nitrospira sp.]